MSVAPDPVKIRSIGARGARAMRRLRRAADRVGVVEQSLERRLSDADDFWTTADDVGWSASSHWRSGLGDEAWLEVGRDHRALYEQFAKALDLSITDRVVIEWGCGGGANAVAFAPSAKKFIAADVSADSLAECKRQIEAACETPSESVPIDIANPEQAIAGREETCDVFVCVYVLELTAGPEEAIRILRIAERVLVSGGLALIQVKYHTSDVETRGYKRNYRRNLSSMTTFAIDEFWSRAADCGLVPRLVTLVPENRLDSRYAYYALTKP
jgi:ubiquinone/menaquinone biosynthesis C-methylase UbiE